MGNAKILVLDDSVVVGRMVKKNLVAIGYDVDVATDGRDALSQIQSNCPDLVICDINMPEMDGFAFCDELKNLGEPFASLPVVFLTAMEPEDLERLGISSGTYLRKPVRREDLVTMVWSKLQKTQSAGMPSG